VVVVPDDGGECEEASPDAHEYAGEGAGTVVFEVELAFESWMPPWWRRPAGLKIWLWLLLADVDALWRAEPVFESDAGSRFRGPALLPSSTRVRFLLCPSVPAGGGPR
jgi:hypothetical protein